MTHPIDLQSIIRGLTALTGLMYVPQVRTTVAIFYTDFMAATEQINVLGDYKDVHDNLHQLQFLCYNSIVTQSNRFPDDTTTIDILLDHELTLRTLVRRLQRVAARPTLQSDELTWIQDLVLAQGHLQTAIDTLDSAELKRCCWLIHRVLDRYPSLINARLNAAARSLRMESIVQAMMAIQKLLVDLDLGSAEVEGFALSVSSLSDLNHRLITLVRDHDRWQDIDVQFRGIDAVIDRDMEMLEMSWPDLQTRIAALAFDESLDWVQNMHRSGSALDVAMTNQDPVKIRIFFRRYRRVAGERFFQVDTELKDLCGQLRDLGTPLAAVAQTISTRMPQPSLNEETRPDTKTEMQADDRSRFTVQLEEQRGRYDALTEKIGALDKDIARALDSERRLVLKQRRDDREAERNIVHAKTIEIEARIAALSDRQ